MSSRPANKAIHLSVLRVTALANRRKRRAARPAGYRERSAVQ
jgi:hypothetical protein